MPAVGGQVSWGPDGLGWPRMEQLVCIMHLLILQEASLVWEQQGLLGPRLQIGTMEQSLLPRSFDYRK